MHSALELDDKRFQGAVLSLVLSEHPAILAFKDIELELGAEDQVDRAVEDLVAVGLLRREGASVLPTRAALRFDLVAA